MAILETIGAIAEIAQAAGGLYGMSQQERRAKQARSQQREAEKQGRIMGAQQSAERAAAQVAEQSGMRRRQEAIAFDPLTAIRQAETELNALPANQLPEVRNAIQNALAIAERNQQLGRQV